MRFASAALVLALLSSVSRADPAPTPPPDGSTTPAAPVAPSPSSSTSDPALSGDKPHYGVDIRLRATFVPTGVLKWFVNRALGGHNFGYGIDFVRRKGHLELALGIEHEQVSVGQGVWINHGDTVPYDDPDYVVTGADAQDGGLGWTTIDFTFINHVDLGTKYVSFRYGAGVGIGIINGALDHYNVHCNAALNPTNANPDGTGGACTPAVLGGSAQVTDANGNPISTNTQYKYNIPPVFPVIDVLVGFQFHPYSRMVISIEGGLHTLPFFGGNIGFFFN